jgi:hypothetical protein
LWCQLSKFTTSQRDKDLDRMSECGKDDSFQKAKEFLEHFIKDLKDFLKRFVRTDQTYIFHITMKEESEWWKHINSYLQKKLKQFHLSTSGASALWNSKEIILIDYLLKYQIMLFNQNDQRKTEMTKKLLFSKFSVKLSSALIPNFFHIH